MLLGQLILLQTHHLYVVLDNFIYNWPRIKKTLREESLTVGKKNNSRALSDAL
jgi:hypothetical protein